MSFTPAYEESTIALFSFNFNVHFAQHNLLSLVFNYIVSNFVTQLLVIKSIIWIISSYKFYSYLFFIYWFGIADFINTCIP